MIDAQQIRKTLWEPLLKRSGVRHRNPYQCRHTYASSMLTAGQNPWYVAQQPGHVDVQMVFKVYGKFIAADYQRPAMLAGRAAAALRPSSGRVAAIRPARRLRRSRSGVGVQIFR